MEDFLKNGIVQAVFATLIVTVLFWLFSISKFKLNEKKIIEFLTKSADDTQYLFRTTHVISSELNLSEDRVRKICSSSKKIKRNKKEKETWQLK